MEAHKVTLLVVDHDCIGAESVKQELENGRYGNDCINPQAMSVETREIGEWDDSHPLNRTDTAPQAFAALFGVAPDFRGYAHLGTGQYLLNHTAKGDPAELVISIATEEEKAGRVVGDHRDNPHGHQIQPEAMAVRLRFATVAGLDALEAQLRFLREEHFPESAPAT